MNASEQSRFNQLYEDHLRALKLQGLSDKTIDVYARAVRRVTAYFDCCPDHLSTDQLASCFANRDGRLTFKCLDSQTGKPQYRTEKGEDFLWLVLQHVLPKGFRRARDAGFLHGNAKRILSLVQLILRVRLAIPVSRSRPVIRCLECRSPMRNIDIIRPGWSSG